MSSTTSSTSLKFVKPDRAEQLRLEALDLATAERFARMAQALADPTRLQILDLLRSEGELIVRDLCVLTERTQSAISRHLGILRSAELIKSYRFDVWVYNALTPEGERLFAAITDSER
jgi:ArsR family transcriptional regulator, arsenate/arsenite/antimonite-responsive transcriptional repressor